MDVQLTVVDHYAKKKQVVALRLPAVLGRDEHADVPLTDPWASHRHCVLTEVDGNVVLTDLASRNGVFLHSHRISQSQILPGDRISIGQTEITVQYQRNASPAVDTVPNILDTKVSPPCPEDPPPEPETRDLLYGAASGSGKAQTAPQDEP